MAIKESNQSNKANQPNQNVSMQRSRTGRSDLSRWDTGAYGPFAWMRQMQDQIDRTFSSLWGGPATESGMINPSEWAPAVDVFQRGNDLVIRADLPGLTKDDITVDVADDEVTIRGERRYDHEEEKDGVFRSERSYGSFYRMIPLPQGAIADSAKATFNNGVLEVRLQAPSTDVRRGRRVDIKEQAPEKKQDQQKA